MVANFAVFVQNMFLGNSRDGVVDFYFTPRLLPAPCPAELTSGAKLRETVRSPNSTNPQSIFLRELATTDLRVLPDSRNRFDRLSAA